MRPSAAGRVAVGHPVDVATGVLFDDFDDLVVPGRMPLAFSRRYSTALADREDGMFGPGWASPFEMAVIRDLDGYRVRLEDGETEIEFPDPDDRLQAGDTLRNFGAFCELRLERGQLVLARWDPDADLLRWHFAMTAPGGWSPLVSRQDLEGQGIDVLRDARGVILALRQRREGRGLRLAYDRAGRLTEVFQIARLPESALRLPALGPRDKPALRYRYDEAGRLGEAVNALDHRRLYFYDDAGRMIREVTAGGMVYRFRYDAQGRCVENTGEDGFGLTELQFDDPAGITRVSDALGQVTTYHWNDGGQVVKEISPLGKVTSRVYDEHGRVAQVVQPNGGVTCFEYDAGGNRSAITDPTGATTSFRYNDRHQLVGATDPAGHAWQWEYNGLGQLTRMVNHKGDSYLSRYNTRGDLWQTEDAAGNVRRLDWDDAGNPVALSDWQGNTTRYEYDDLGWLAAVMDPAGHRTRVDRDALGRIRELRFPDGATRRFGWNAYHQLHTYVDERGAMTRVHYSACGLVTEVQRATGGRAQFTYSNIPGQLLTVRNELGEIYTQEYDADGQICRITDFAGRTTRYEELPGGDGTVIQNAAGQRVELKRNLAGWITEVCHDNGSKITYEYDPRGLLTKADNGTCPVERAYDEVGRMVRENQGGREVTSAYDRLGNRVSRGSSLGYLATFDWDSNGNLVSLTARGLPPIQFRYDSRGAEVSREFSNGTRVQQSHDAMGRCIEQRLMGAGRGWPQGGNRWIQRDYAYDPAGNLTDVQDQYAGPTRYAYDPAGRVVHASYAANREERFVYDAGDNLLEREQAPGGAGTAVPAAAPGRQHFHYGPGGRLDRREGTAYEYDALGQLMREAGTDGVTSYSWNRFGQLEKVTLPSGASWTYSYDALGRRIEKRGPTGAVQYVWDGDVVLHEIREAGSDSDVADWEFDPFGYAPLCKTRDGRQHLCVNAPNGHPRELVARDGVVPWADQPTAYGEFWQDRAETEDCPVRFPGQWYDDETGLHYNRYRYYDPATGRYLSPDPVGLEGGLNPYGYPANPIRWADPLGLEVTWVNPWTLNFTQRNVAANTLDYQRRMGPGGDWDWNRPDAVLRVMNVNGQLVSYDNRRLRAAQNAGVQSVPVQIVNPTDINPQTGRTWAEDFRRRRTDSRNNPDGGPIPEQGVKQQPRVRCKK